MGKMITYLFFHFNVDVLICVLFYDLDSSRGAITASADVLSRGKSTQSESLITSAHVISVLDKFHIPYTQSQYTG